jgi:DNA-binding protein HU-beta
MNKQELIKEIQNRTNMTTADSFRILDCFVETISQTLKKHEKVTISGFGTWEIKNRAQRLGRNPKTGEEVIIKPTQVAKFIPSKILKAAVNNK